MGLDTKMPPQLAEKEIVLNWFGGNYFLYLEMPEDVLQQWYAMGEIEARYAKLAQLKQQAK